MVDLPPKGQKKKKNSRKMQMVFFVFYGRVVVEVAGNVFSIGKGGMWQVPRGQLSCLPLPILCHVSFHDVVITAGCLKFEGQLTFGTFCPNLKFYAVRKMASRY